jgi:DNA-binding XRE family transcriptional regulator
MTDEDKKKIYEAARNVCMIAVRGLDAEIDDDNMEDIVDEELITVIDKINKPAEEPPMSLDDKKHQTRERIGQRITALRKMQGMTITELAERADIGRGHLSRIESGKYAVSLDILQAIAEALGMTIDLIDERLTDLAPLKVM